MSKVKIRESLYILGMQRRYPFNLTIFFLRIFFKIITLGFTLIDFVPKTCWDTQSQTPKLPMVAIFNIATFFQHCDFWDDFENATF